MWAFLWYTLLLQQKHKLCGCKNNVFKRFLTVPLYIPAGFCYNKAYARGGWVVEQRPLSDALEARLKDLMSAAGDIEQAFAEFMNNIHVIAADDDMDGAIDQVLGFLSALGLQSGKGKPQSNLPLVTGSQWSMAIRDIAALLHDTRISLTSSSNLYTEVTAACQAYRSELEGLIKQCETLIAQVDTPQKEARALIQYGGGNGAFKKSYVYQAFLRKVANLRITQEIMLQSIANIALLQHNNRMLGEQVESLLSHTLPLWQLSAGISQGVTRQAQLIKQQQAINTWARDSVAAERETAPQEGAQAAAAMKAFMGKVGELISPLKSANTQVHASRQQVLHKLGDAVQTLEKTAEAEGLKHE